MENLIERGGMGGNLLKEGGMEERRGLEAVMGLKCDVLYRRSGDIHLSI